MPSPSSGPSTKTKTESTSSVSPSSPTRRRRKTSETVLLRTRTPKDHPRSLSFLTSSYATTYENFLLDDISLSTLSPPLPFSPLNIVSIFRTIRSQNSQPPRLPPRDITARNFPRTASRRGLHPKRLTIEYSTWFRKSLRGFSGQL